MLFKVKQFMGTCVASMSVAERASGALWGLFAGDALAMPVPHGGRKGVLGFALIGYCRPRVLTEALVLRRGRSNSNRFRWPASVWF